MFSSTVGNQGRFKMLCWWISPSTHTFRLFPFSDLGSINSNVQHSREVGDNAAIWCPQLVHVIFVVACLSSGSFLGSWWTVTADGANFCKTCSHENWMRPAPRWTVAMWRMYPIPLQLRWENPPCQLTALSSSACTSWGLPYKHSPLVQKLPHQAVGGSE